MQLNRTLRPSYVLCFALTSSACVIVEPGGDDDVGETSDTSTSDTSTSDTSTSDTSTSDTSTSDTTDTTDTGGEAICPGSEEFCSEAESHCGPDGTLEICQYDPEMDCIFHASVDCAAEVGAGSMCVTISPTEGGCTEALATAQLRFLNLSDGTELNFRVGGMDVPIDNLFFPQSHHYVELPVAGLDVEVEVVDAEGNVVSTTVYPEFVAGHKYTIAAMGVGIWPNTWVNPDEHVDEAVPADNTRLTLVNATPDNDNAIYAQLVYDDVLFIDFFEENQQMLLGYVQQVTVDVPFPTISQSDQMAFAAQWGVPAVYDQYWRGAALAQVANNESLYVFLTCQGACNSNTDRFLLGFMEDSTPFTVELLAP